MKLVNFKATFLLTLIAGSLLFGLNMVQAAIDTTSTSSTSSEIIEQTTTTTTSQTITDLPTASTTTSTTTSSTTLLQPDLTASTSTVSTVTSSASEDSIPTTQTATSSPTSTNSNSTASTTLLSVHLNLRYQDSFIWQGQVALTTSTLVSYHESTTSTVATTTLTQPTVLTALSIADEQSGDFSVSDLVYYTDWGGSYYVNCLQLTTTTACYNWRYAVNNQYPTVGMDKYNLTGGETIYIYFGTPWKITASSSTLPINATTTLTTWRYNYDDLINAWTYNPDNLIDISVNNPSSTGWWDTTITIATTTSGSNGTANYSFTATGTYYAKITSVDWSKWSNPITLTVLDATISPSTTTEQITTNVGGNGSTQNQTQTVSEAEIQLTVDRLINYLRAQQSSNGQIIDGNITDWIIMSAVAAGLNPAEIKSTDNSLFDYAYNYNFTAGSEINKCVAYARHALALYSAGLAKTDKLRQELITKIQSIDCYNNQEYGLIGINDDIFALLALLANGEQANQEIIQTLITNIKNNQQADGSFTWANSSDYDMTGAAVNALKYAQNKGIAIDNQILLKAKNYLKNNQLTDGGWNNSANTADVLTTSWVMMGINAMGEKQAGWSKQDKNPWQVLTGQLKVQADQGYYETSWSPGAVDWFAVKHAIPALLGYSWPIEPKFSQSSPAQTDRNTTGQAGNFTGGTGGYNTSNINNITNTTTAASTIDQPTTTVAVATSNTATVNNNQSRSEAASSASLAKSITKQLINQTSNSQLPTTNFPQEKVEPISPTLTPQFISPAAQLDQRQIANQLINELPLDTPTRQAAKKVLAVSGGSALALGLYLGFKLLKNLV